MYAGNVCLCVCVCITYPPPRTYTHELPDISIYVYQK